MPQVVEPEVIYRCRLFCPRKRPFYIVKSSPVRLTKDLGILLYPKESMIDNVVHWDLSGLTVLTV